MDKFWYMYLTNSLQITSSLLKADDVKFILSGQSVNTSLFFVASEIQ